MEWKEFYSTWLAVIGERMPQETLKQWQEFVSMANSADVKRAIHTLADWYFAAKERDSFTKAPTLYQLRKEVERIAAENKKQEQRSCECTCCDGEKNVIILAGSWNVDDPDFPPDPAGDVRNRKLAVIPCPVCRWGEYRNRDFRERVAARCRSNRRRNELLEVGENE